MTEEYSQFNNLSAQLGHAMEIDPEQIVWKVVRWESGSETITNLSVHVAEKLSKNQNLQFWSVLDGRRNGFGVKIEDVLARGAWDKLPSFDHLILARGDHQGLVKREHEEAKKLVAECRELTSHEHIALVVCRKGVDVPRRDDEVYEELKKLGLVVVSAVAPTGSVTRVVNFRHYEPTVAGLLLIEKLKSHVPKADRVEWEYKIGKYRWVEGDEAHYEGQLNKMGAQGWELCGVLSADAGVALHWKRRKA